MSEFVDIKLSPAFRDIKHGLGPLIDEALEASALILRREEEASIRARFYRTGTGLRSLQDEFVTEGDKRIYRLFPTAFYMKFGEYGTGRRGSASGRPTPRGWRYGGKPGMTARRYSRIAVAKAKPQIDALFESRVRAFARNVTVN